MKVLSFLQPLSTWSLLKESPSLLLQTNPSSTSSNCVPVFQSQFFPQKSPFFLRQNLRFSPKNQILPPKNHPNPIILHPKNRLHPLLQESPSWAIRLDDRLGTGLFQLLHCVLSNKTRGPDFFWWRSSTKIGRYRDFRIQIIQQFLAVTDLPTRYHRDMIKIKYDYNQ